MNTEGIVTLPVTEYRDLTDSAHTKAEAFRAAAVSSEIVQAERALDFLRMTYPKLLVSNAGTQATINISMGKWIRLNEFSGMTNAELVDTIS